MPSGRNLGRAPYGALAHRVEGREFAIVEGARVVERLGSLTESSQINDGMFDELADIRAPWVLPGRRSRPARGHVSRSLLVIWASRASAQYTGGNELLL